jgi:signal transduction histidine kinase
MADSIHSARDHTDHVVQFYSEDAFLIRQLSVLIGVALAEGSAAVVIASGSHREQLLRSLHLGGHNTVAASNEHRLQLLDASETLSKFMVNDLPDGGLFRDIVGKVLARATTAAQGDSPRVVAFGEMVAELWASGNAEGAIQLENLWNQLGKTYVFSLHCAYPLSGFNRVEHAEALERICAAHSAVIPDESYTGLGSDPERAFAVMQLQQKARALETEMADKLRIQQELLVSQEGLQRSHSELERRVQERTRELMEVQEALRLLSHRLLTIRDEERRKFALELHDGVSQTLTALQINLAAIEQAEKLAGNGGSPKLRETFRLADQAMREVRRLSYRLHPPLLEQPGLEFALKWYMTGFSERTEVDAQLDVPCDLKRLSHHLELAIFRIVEEGLDNVHRHSGSKTARVRLAIRNDEIDLRIEDSGKGIDSRVVNGPRIFSLGAGITGMIERVKQCGGTFAIRSAEPGTSIRITLPVRFENEDAVPETVPQVDAA